jgi:hypothetical protein
MYCYEFDIYVIYIYYFQYSYFILSKIQAYVSYSSS